QPCGERPAGRGREPARGRAARRAAAPVRGRAAGRPAARRQSPDHVAGGSGQRLGLGARRSRRGRHHRWRGEPGGAERDRPDRARVVRDRAFRRRRAARAHMTRHAGRLEAMGHAFGSGAEEIFAEGVIVPPLRLTAEVERFLLANVRTAETGRADLGAQRAAVARGAEGLRALAARYGWAAVRGAASDLLDYAERRAREALGQLTASALTATDWLEGDGVDDADLAISVRVDVTDGVFH